MPPFDRILPSLKSLLWCLCQRIPVGSGHAAPRLFVSVVAQGELVDAVLPLVQGFMLTSTTYSSLVDVVRAVPALAPSVRAH